jgi:hypothetical protein
MSGEFFQRFKEQILLIYENLPKKTKEGTSSSLFYEEGCEFDIKTW